MFYAVILLTIALGGCAAVFPALEFRVGRPEDAAARVEVDRLPARRRCDVVGDAMIVADPATRAGAQRQGLLFSRGVAAGCW